jgi:hypothetical protein
MISLIHPSRGRPQKAKETHERWWDKWKGPLYYEHILSIDNDDPHKNKYVELFEGCVDDIVTGDNKSVVDATNAAAKIARGDILVYLSDDFDCPDHWDKLIDDEFRNNKPMLLKVDDCLQPFKVGVCTIPMMNRTLYDLLGYFWHPDYKSMHVDVDLYETCKKIGAIKYAPHLKFPHNHYSNGKAPRDETYTRSEANWNQGLEVINRRRRQGFPI